MRFVPLLVVVVVVAVVVAFQSFDTVLVVVVVVVVLGVVSTIRDDMGQVVRLNGQRQTILNRIIVPFQVIWWTLWWSRTCGGL